MKIRIQEGEVYPFYEPIEDETPDWFPDEIVDMEKEEFERYQKAFVEFRKIQDELAKRLEKAQEEYDGTVHNQEKESIG